MVKRKNKTIAKVIKIFAEELQKDIPVEKILVYGSYAAGKQDKQSDIDVIVVSSVFARGNHMAHMQYLFRKAAKINSLLEPIPASPREIDMPDTRLFIGQVIKSAQIYYRA